MLNATRAMTLLFVLFISSSLSAQQPEFPVPEKEHAWLKQFVGEWATTSKGSMGPDQPPVECVGTIDGKMLGEFWVVNRMEATVAGAPFVGIQTIGYDAEKKKYIGTWVDSMLGHLWRYEGSVDSSGKKLSLEATGPNFMVPGETAKYRDSYEFTSADHILVTSEIQGEDGKWNTMMSGEAQRKK